VLQIIGLVPGSKGSPRLRPTASTPKPTFCERSQHALKRGSFDIPQQMGGLQNGCLSLRAN